MVGSADHGVAEAAAGLGADVRVDGPATQDVLPIEPRLLHNMGEGAVLYVAAGADPPNAILTHGPACDFASASAISPCPHPACSGPWPQSSRCGLERRNSRAPTS